MLFITQTGGDFSRIVFIAFFFIALIALYVERIFWKKALFSQKTKKTYSQSHLLIVTHSSIAESTIKRTLENSFGEYEVIGIVLSDKNTEGSEKVLREISGVPVVCAIDEMADYIHNKWVDEALFCFPKESDIPVNALDDCVEMGITVHITLNFLMERSNAHAVEKFAGRTVVTESLRMASPKHMFIKRVMDIAGAIIGLIATAFLTVIVGPLIYLSDPGPIFFAQPRIGKNGRVFKCYKFRSMYRNAESQKAELLDKNMMDGFMFKMDNDPRILGSGSDGKRHGIGWFLRKYSIDEFPQFLNVLRGELCLVGTRPPLLEEWEQYEARHRVRMSIQPGITGLWQVSGRNQIRNFEEIVALDMKYAQNWSIGEDIKIIFKTLRVIFSGTGAQ